jgi:hypothetical protein
MKYVDTDYYLGIDRIVANYENRLLDQKEEIDRVNHANVELRALVMQGKARIVELVAEANQRRRAENRAKHD